MTPDIAYPVHVPMHGLSPQDIRARISHTGDRFRSTLDLMELLCEVKTRSLYLNYGYASLWEWAHVESGLSRSTVRQYIMIWECLVVESGMSRDDITGIPWTTLRIIAMALVRGVVGIPGAHELLALAPTHTRAQLSAHIRGIEIDRHGSPSIRTIRIDGHLSSTWDSVSKRVRRSVGSRDLSHVAVLDYLCLAFLASQPGSPRPVETLQAMIQSIQRLYPGMAIFAVDSRYIDLVRAFITSLQATAVVEDNT